MKRLALLVLGPMVAATFWVAAPASAQTGNDNSAVAVNTKDNSFLFKFAFKVSRAGGDTTDASNGTAAVSSCRYCVTVAVAIQVVLVTGSPNTFTPSNVAIAYNQDCYECVSLADAFQFVFGTGSRPAHLTPEGNRELALIRQQYEQLRHSGLPPDQLQAQIEQLARQVYQVFTTQLVSAGPPRAASSSTPSSSASPSSTAGTTTPPTTSGATETTGG